MSQEASTWKRVTNICRLSKIPANQNCHVLYDLGSSEEFIIFKVNELLVLLLLNPKFWTVPLSYASIEYDYEAD